jgi:hypothetical protein
MRCSPPGPLKVGEMSSHCAARTARPARLARQAPGCATFDARPCQVARPLMPQKSLNLAAPVVWDRRRNGDVHRVGRTSRPAPPSWGFFESRILSCGSARGVFPVCPIVWGFSPRREPAARRTSTNPQVENWHVLGSIRGGPTQWVDETPLPARTRTTSQATCENFCCPHTTGRLVSGRSHTMQSSPSPAKFCEF